MTNLIVEVSKYLMILLMAVYTYANFRYFSLKDMGRKQRVCAGQNRAMYAIHFLAYAVMYLKTENDGVRLMLIAFYVAQVVFFLCYIYLYRFLYRNVSRLLVNNTCMLLCVGFIMLSRLSLDKGLDKAVRQYVIVVISACLAWSNPWADIDNKGYQITQSLFAIGTGGWFGMGLCQGMPGKIPVVEKDFIFAAVSEEMGGIFAICVLLICLGCFIQFMMIAASMQAVFYKLIAFGLGIEYISQVFLTVGGVTKFIPSTGVTLPFVSYGGSSILSTFILFGIIQGLYILKRNDEEELDGV